MILEPTRLITLFDTLSDQSNTPPNCAFYLDTLDLLLKENPSFCLAEEKEWIKKILRLEINPNPQTFSKWPLTPIFCPNFESNYSTTAELINKCFEPSEIDLLIKISDDHDHRDVKNICSDSVTKRSEITARINDLLRCCKHKEEQIRKRTRTFAVRAIENYICASHQENYDKSSIRLVRATELAVLIHLHKRDLLDKREKKVFTSLNFALSQKIRSLDYKNHVISGILESYSKLNPNLNIATLEIVEIAKSILDDNDPTQKAGWNVLKNCFHLCSFLIQYSCKDNAVCNIYREKQIKYCLSLLDSFEKLNYPPDCVEDMLKKIPSSAPGSKQLHDKIKEYKGKYNKLPEGMVYQSTFSPYQISFDEVKRLQEMSLQESLKTIFSVFKNRDLKPFLEAGGPMSNSANICTTDEKENILYDQKPESILYTDKELEEIWFISTLDRQRDGKKLEYFFECLREKFFKSAEDNWLKDFVILKKSMGSIIPNGRKMIIINAIQAMISGDICTALHLIIPQTENYLNLFLEKKGKSPSVLTNENNHEARSLSQIFQKKDLAEIIIEKYGHDTFCLLYLLLLDKRCGNYRNRLSHGTMDFNDFHQEDVFYAYGLCLYIILKEALFD